MAIVIFSSELQQLTGEVQTEITALSYRDMLDELLLKFNNLDRQELARMAVAIDGLIISDPLLESIPADAEIHFFPFVSGG